MSFTQASAIKIVVSKQEATNVLSVQKGLKGEKQFIIHEGF